MQLSLQLQCYAAALSKVTGRPVKVALTKEEHLASFVLRPATQLDGQVGMKKDGTVTAVAGSWLLGTGHYSMTTQVTDGCWVWRSHDCGTVQELEFDSQNRVY